MRRLTILKDQDGPLAHFDAHFFEMVQANDFFIEVTLEEQRHRFATDHIPDKAQRAAARKIVESDLDWFLDLPPTPGAIEGINELQEHHDVWICTKPLEANPRCRDAKAEWVKQHLGDFWVQRLIITPDKSMVRGDILVDDAPKPEWFSRASWIPVIFPSGFNGPDSKWAGLPRWHWEDGVEALEDIWLAHEYLDVVE